MLSFLPSTLCSGGEQDEHNHRDNRGHGFDPRGRGNPLGMPWIATDQNIQLGFPVEAVLVRGRIATAPVIPRNMKIQRVGRRTILDPRDNGRIDQRIHLFPGGDRMTVQQPW
jgi:hypothetical protein